MRKLSKKFTIGTRGSLLAVSQCELLKWEIERKTGARFDIKTIKTEGDLKTEKPLWQMDGKDFFTKELDHALKNHEVDLVIHSYKDLGSERPEDFYLGAITERKYGEDILLIKRETIKNLPNLSQLKVGTSSPRRIVNIEKNLDRFIPNFEGSIKAENLRGNVNTRIEKLREDKYDAIVLAFAGLERLASHPDSKSKVFDLIEGLTFLILPHTTFPSSSSQGALGVEICKTNPRFEELKEILNTVNHSDTIEELKIERERFKSFGGGCHLAVGIQADKINDNEFLLIEKGEHQDREVSKKVIVDNKGIENSPQKIQLGNTNVFIGYREDVLNKMDTANKLAKISSKILSDECLTKVVKSEQELKQLMNVQQGSFFATSKYTMDALNLVNKDKINSLWAPGSKTTSRLIENGYWVNGSADGFGHKKIKNFLNSNLMKAFLGSTIDDLKILTGDEAKSNFGRPITTYTRNMKDQEELTSEYIEKMQNTSVFYWSSFPQFLQFRKSFSFLKTPKDDKNILFFCGLGKTLESFQTEGIPVIGVHSLFDFIDRIDL